MADFNLLTSRTWMVELMALFVVVVMAVPVCCFRGFMAGCPGPGTIRGWMSGRPCECEASRCDAFMVLTHTMSGYGRLAAEPGTKSGKEFRRV